MVNHKTDKNFIIYFYVNERGTVIYSIDGLTEEVLLHGVKTDCTLWAMIDLYGNSKLVELVKTELKTDIIPHPKAEFNSNFTLTYVLIFFRANVIRFLKRDDEKLFYVIFFILIEYEE